MMPTKSWRAPVMAVLLWMCLTISIAIAEEGCLCLEEVATDMKAPLDLTSPNDETNRLFIATQEGVIYIHAMDGTPYDLPFINLTDRVTIAGGYHNGLVGMTFHPEFKENKKFYVTYTALDDSDGLDWYRLSEFSASVEDDNLGLPDTERILISLKKPSEIHHAGQVFFGVDNYLYMFIGDGGPETDPHDNAQNRSNLFGSILRIDVDSPQDGLLYGIPPDNPFVNESDSEVRHEIYAYGFRNPFRGGQDKGDSETGYGRGRLFCGDAGHYSYEEINLVKAGHNYGWNFREGGDCVRDEICGGDYRGRQEEFPLYVYNRTGQVAAVIGSTVYRGCRNPHLNGLYFFSDFGLGSVSVLKENTLVTDYWENIELGICPVEQCPEGMKASKGMFTKSFGEDSHGELYVITSNGFLATDRGGSVHRLVDPRTHAELLQCWTSDSTSDSTSDRTSGDTTSNGTIGGTGRTVPMGTMMYLVSCLISCLVMLVNSNDN